VSSILTLADEGYRKFGSSALASGGLTPEQAAHRVSICTDYEIAGSHIRRIGRRKNGRVPTGLNIVDIWDRQSTLDEARLAFVDDHLRSEFEASDMHSFRADEQAMDWLVQAVKEPGKRHVTVQRMAQALAFAGPQRLRPALRDCVAPAFFDLYPEGKIVVIRYDTTHDTVAALQRVLYAAAQVPLPEVAANSTTGIATLQSWHLNSIVTAGPLLLDTLLYGFYPFVGGLRGGPVGLDFLFLFEPAERYEPAPFPRDWLSMPAFSARFGLEKVDAVDVVRNFRGPPWLLAGHQRYRHDNGYTADARLALLKWYVERTNRILYELVDVANFTRRDDTEGDIIDPVFAFEHHVSFDRLLRKTVLSMALDEPGTAKLTAFEIAELYDGLTVRFGASRKGSDMFRRLFHPIDGPAMLISRLATLPAPFADDLVRLTGDLYKRIEDTIIESIWLRSKVTPAGILVKDRHLRTENVESRPDFVAALMRAFRNAHHGYFTASDEKGRRPSRYLFLVNGNLPAEMTALPTLWWLAYLADPGMVGWRHLPVNIFD
jgi:hypothetical protein